MSNYVGGISSATGFQNTFMDTLKQQQQQQQQQGRIYLIKIFKF